MEEKQIRKILDYCSKKSIIDALIECGGGWPEQVASFAAAREAKTLIAGHQAMLKAIQAEGRDPAASRKGRSEQLMRLAKLAKQADGYMARIRRLSAAL